MDGIPRKRYGSKGNAHQGAAASSSSPGKRKGKAAAGGGGGKKKPPIKVVYIGNPMRVTTSEAGFRALVQELTGRHADPYKYSGSGSGSGSAAVDAPTTAAGAARWGRKAGALPISPVSTPSSDAASAAGAAHASSSVPAAYDDDEDSFAAQLIDNSYSVFSPPTFLYGPHGDGELM
ncbi:uncharacterized protein LOC120665085 [Panicum virgatum]|uniref:VQ domain-containing protein n=1 Tax=Panicum virgatum TaxID=38727 RepID=A0A8T0UBM5_PANVG|nr:uncharacterized protein LOC120665085 [Panicum virgatum]KAG2618446.1 hypothetical protein PVAP13_3NG079593 [Panicum virgatum]